jgi:hypothetical protein
MANQTESPDRSLPHRRALLAGLAAIVPTAAIATAIPASPDADAELIALGHKVSELSAQAQAIGPESLTALTISTMK